MAEQTVHGIKGLGKASLSDIRKDYKAKEAQNTEMQREHAERDVQGEEDSTSFEWWGVEQGQE